MDPIFLSHKELIRHRGSPSTWIFKQNLPLSKIRSQGVSCAAVRLISGVGLAGKFPMCPQRCSLSNQKSIPQAYRYQGQLRLSCIRWVLVKSQVLNVRSQFFEQNKPFMRAPWADVSTSCAREESRIVVSSNLRTNYSPLNYGCLFAFVLSR